jgi:phosphatidylserine/phosphatidylglycerophosphate/cardiolipin synthase-like enzyme
MPRLTTPPRLLEPQQHALQQHVGALLLLKQRHAAVVVRAQVALHALEGGEALHEGTHGGGEVATRHVHLAGAQVRVVGAYAIFHDKAILMDGVTVQTGSYNYSQAAATSNSENVIVHWNNPELAAVYGKHFLRNWNASEAFKPEY